MRISRPKVEVAPTCFVALIMRMQEQEEDVDIVQGMDAEEVTYAHLVQVRLSARRHGYMVSQHVLPGIGCCVEVLEEKCKKRALGRVRVPE